LDIAGQTDSAAYHTPDGLCVGAGIQETTILGPLLKVAVWHLRKDPSWHEITTIKNLFLGPDVSAMQMLPREDLHIRGYAGKATHIFHIWQMPTTWERAFWP
jgi:hypothetical protein